MRHLMGPGRIRDAFRAEAGAERYRAFVRAANAACGLRGPVVKRWEEWKS